MQVARRKSATTAVFKAPRVTSFAGFVCAQPFDIPAKEIVELARKLGFGEFQESTVHSSRLRFGHLQFKSGEAPTSWVEEFLASDKASARAKSVTAKNSLITIEHPKVKKRPVEEVIDITSIVDRVLIDSAPVARAKEPRPAIVEAVVAKDFDPEAPWGRCNDGTPKKKTGRKPKTATESLSPREQRAIELETLRELEGSHETSSGEQLLVENGLKISEQGVIIGEPEPTKNEVPEPKAKTEEDDMKLQELRDSFEVGDPVFVLQQSTVNGGSFTRQGRIVGKDAKFAAVAVGSTTQKIPYKQLSLDDGDGEVPTRANTNGHSLKAVPPAFQALRSASQREVDFTFRKGHSSKPAAPTLVDPGFSSALIPPAPAPTTTDTAKPAVAAVAPVPKPAVKPAVVAPAPVPKPPAASKPATEGDSDFLAWIEMGVSTAATLRAEADAITKEIQRLTTVREQKLKDADQIEGFRKLLTSQVTQ